MSHSSSGNPVETNADCTRCRRTTTTSALVAVLTVPVDSKGLVDPREAKTCGALCDPCLTAVLTNIERTSA